MAYVMPNGKHRGQDIARVPASYLHWLIQHGHSASSYVKYELKRRGMSLPAIGIGASAIDSASFTVMNIWRSRNPVRASGEGFHTWLSRMASESLDQGYQTGEHQFDHMGVRFVFEMAGPYTILERVESCAYRPPKKLREIVKD